MPEPTQDVIERVQAAVNLAAKYVRDDHEYTLVSYLRDNEFAEAFVTLADLRTILAALRPTEPTPEQGRVECKWWQDERPDDSLWYSGCGQEWIFNAFGPVENGCKFCHHCGGPVVITERTERIDLGDG